MANCLEKVFGCTWKNCPNFSVHDELDKDGNIWARLCEKHKKELDDAIENFDPRKILRVWVLASGGAEKMSEMLFNGEDK